MKNKKFILYFTFLIIIFNIIFHIIKILKIIIGFKLGKYTYDKNSKFNLKLNV